MKNFISLTALLMCSFLFLGNALAQNPSVANGVATYTANKNIGRKFLVPDSWDKIVIKKNVTITGSFYMPNRTKPIEIMGESRQTSIIQGDGSRPTDDGIKGRSYSAIRCDKSPDLYVHDLRSLNPMKFHIHGGFGNVTVERCDLIENRGTHTTDGVHGGKQKTIVKDCYIDTWDDALYTIECKLVENTTIVHNKNGSPFMTSWGADVPANNVCVVRNCTVIDNHNGTDYNHGVFGWSRKNDSGSQTNTIKFEGSFTRQVASGKKASKVYTIGRPLGENVANATLKIDGLCPYNNSIEYRPCTSNCQVTFVNCGTQTANQPIPGKIEAESYSSQSGINTQNTSDTGGGQNVGWIGTGDWMDYKVDVAAAGDYTVKFRVASASNNIKLDLKKGNTVLGSINASTSNGWQTWKTVSTVVTLAKGSQTLRVQATGGGWNFNWMEFTGSTTSPPPPPPSSSSYFLVDHNSSGKRFKFNGNGSIVLQSGGIGDWVQFQEVSTSNGYFYLVHKATGNKLSTDNGTNVKQVSASETANKAQWKWVDAGGGWSRLENRQYGTWLHIAQDGTSNLRLGPTSWTGNNTKWKKTDIASATSISVISAPKANVSTVDAVRVYPNPATDLISITSAAEQSNITLFDVSGKMLLNTKLMQKNTNLNISHLKSGVYFAVIQYEGGSVTKKIIKN